MARKTKEQQWAEIHAQAIIEFDAIQGAVKDERKQCLEDRRFYSIAGAQWEGSLGEQFANKPRFEVNKIHLSVIRIINEYRNNRITVDFKSRAGAKDDSLSDVCDGLFRADEIDSGAEESYDNCFEEGTSGGMGAIRLRAQYEDESDEENDRQRIMIEPIFDADSSVFFDIGSKRQDKKDAKHCYVINSIPRIQYEDEYSDDVDSWDKLITDSEYDWATDDVVYLAEYYKVEEKKETLHVWQDIDGSELRMSDDELEIQLEKLVATGAKELRIKKVVKKKIRKYIMSGSKILEDCGYIAGTCLPIIPFYGKRWFIDGVERCMGHVRLAKDAQRLKNMQTSKLAEISAQDSKEKPILTPEQIAGHEQSWASENIENLAYLLINPVTDVNGNEVAAGPVGYTKPANVPPALAALLGLTEQDMNDVLGNNQNGEQMIGNISTETAHLIQNRLDMQTFIYMSNFAKTMKRVGEVWLSMAQDLYVESDREMEVITEDGVNSSIKINELSDMSGGIEYKNDLANAKLKVVSSVGAASSTKRMATTRALMNMMSQTQDPETHQVLSSLTMMNMEGEGVEDARQYFRKRLVQMGVIEPTEEEEEAMQAAQANQQQQPDPQQIALNIQQMQAQTALLDQQNRQGENQLKLASLKLDMQQKKEKTESDLAVNAAKIDQEQQKINMQGEKQQSEFALKLTEMEQAQGRQLDGEVASNKLMFDPVTGVFS